MHINKTKIISTAVSVLVSTLLVAGVVFAVTIISATTVTLSNGATIANSKAGQVEVAGMTTADGAGSRGLYVNVNQKADTALTGTLMGAQIVATNGTTNGTGAVKGIEAKARAGSGGATTTIGELTALYGSADAKKGTITNLRGAELSLDAEAGAAITTAVGLRVANNMSANPTNVYGIEIATASQPYTADIVLNNGAKIWNQKAGQVNIAGLTTADGAGSRGLYVNVNQKADTALTGTLMGAQIQAIASKADSSASGAVKGVEFKAKAYDDVASKVNEVTAIYGSADAKKGTVTTLRGAELSLDGSAGGSATTAVGLRIANNTSATFTNTYGIEIGGPAAFNIDIYKSGADHLRINTNPTNSDKTIQLNSQTYTVDNSIIGFQSKPRAGVTLTHNIYGAEFEPGINDGFNGVGIVGVASRPTIKGTTTDLSGSVYAFEADIGSPSDSTGTITGTGAALKAFNSFHGTVTGGVYVIDVLDAGGNKAWDGLVKLPDDDQIASKDEAGTSGTKAGWIKVKVGDTVGYIWLYDAGD